MMLLKTYIQQLIYQCIIYINSKNKLMNIFDSLNADNFL